MGRRGTVVGLVLLLLLSGCGDDGCDSDNVSWRAAFITSEGNSTSTGGLVIVASDKTLAAAEPWLLGELEPFPGPIPPVELVSIDEALFLAGPDQEVVDAIAAPDGTVALLADPGGAVILRHFADPVGVTVPEGVRRILLVSEAPVRVLLVVDDDEAILAISAR